MGRLGAHPHIVAVFDLGEEDGQPYLVSEFMGGGDVEGLLDRTPKRQLPLDGSFASRPGSPGASRSPTKRGSSTATSSPATSG